MWVGLLHSRVNRADGRYVSDKDVATNDLFHYFREQVPTSRYALPILIDMKRFTVSGLQRRAVELQYGNRFVERIADEVPAGLPGVSDCQDQNIFIALPSPTELIAVEIWPREGSLRPCLQTIPPSSRVWKISAASTRARTSTAGFLSQPLDAIAGEPAQAMVECTG
jgi:hypothetical protein